MPQEQDTDSKNKTIMIFNNFGFNAQGVVFTVPPIPTSGSVLNLDAANYPGTGTSWPDASPSNNAGSLQNSPSYTSGTAPYFSFVSSNSQYVSFNSPTNIPIGRSNYTIIVWMQIASVGKNGLVGWGTYNSGNNKVNALRTTNPNGLMNYWWANDIEQAFTFNTGTWYQCVASYAITGDTRRLYINNSQVKSDTPTAAQNVDTSANLTVAATWRAAGENEYLNGRLSSARIYNRTLTTEEIAADYAAFQYRFGV